MNSVMGGAFLQSSYSKQSKRSLLSAPNSDALAVLPKRWGSDQPLYVLEWGGGLWLHLPEMEEAVTSKTAVFEAPDYCRVCYSWEGC